MPLILALIGPAGSGKSTLAGQLSLWRHFVRKPFAARLKGMLTNFLESQGLDSITVDRMLNGDLKEAPTPYLSGRAPRHAMQTLGTEWRDLIHKNLWVDAWEAEVKHLWTQSDLNVVVEDCRFLHEAERVHQLGGRIICIRRLGFMPNFGHLSESEFVNIKADLELSNDGPPERMFRDLTFLLPELQIDSNA